MKHIAMTATIPLIVLMIWLLFLRRSVLKRPWIWVCIGVLFASLCYRFNGMWACVGLVLVSILLVRFRRIESISPEGN